MCLDRIEFIFGECGRLIEDSVRDTYLANVMQESENVDLILPGIRETAPFCDDARKTRGFRQLRRKTG